MEWQTTLDKVWTATGRKTNVKVRFSDWTHQIKYFVIAGESSDGKRPIGVLDTGEKISFSKKSRGWSVYQMEDEKYQAHAV